MSDKIKVSIIGAGGYTGEELLRILVNHPKVEIVEAVARSHKGEKIGEIYHHLNPHDYDSMLFTDKTDYSAELYFVCLPHGESMGVVADLIGKGKKVIDLSADFRIKDVSTYEKWYVPHSAKDLIEKAVYGLPELNGDKLKGSELIANPGCYPTGALLALLPIAKEIETKVIIDSKSGVSGAGRSVEEEMTEFCNERDFKAYKIGSHRHEPEIKQGLDFVSGNDFSVTFTPHLLPVFRGILTTVYVTLKDNSTLEELLEKYTVYYMDKPFVSVLGEGEMPSISSVTMTNNCHIGVYVADNGCDCVIVSAIDNLVKGASGEAVQNMNLMYGFDETLGLK